MIVVDSHEDIAWNVLTFGRDYLQSVAETRERESGTDITSRNGNTMLGWPNWIEGRVAVVFSTLFAAPVRFKEGPWDTQCYADREEAYRMYRAQLQHYQRWFEERPDAFCRIANQSELKNALVPWEMDNREAQRVGLVLLMEGADGIRHPDELEEWYEAGVRIIGPAWKGTRYAGGTGEPGPLTKDGFALLENMAEVGMILDLSHLAEEAARQALDHYPGTIIASHSNVRSLLMDSPFPDRHLSEPVIRGIAEREGVIGVVLFNRFLVGGWVPSDGREAVSLARVVDQIDAICQCLGDSDHVGLGSDFDGGYGLDSVPEGLDSVADMRLIGDKLQERGYQPQQVGAILGGNWLSLLRRALPEN